MFLRAPLTLVLAAVSSAHSIPRQNGSCSSNLALQHRGDVSILNATYYPSGALNISGTFNAVPFCEIVAAVAYGSNDTLRFATWLADEAHYHDRFLAVGNGGMAGAIDYANMLTQLNSGLGFAVAGGNAGHLTADNNNGEGTPGVYLPYLHDQDQVQAWIHNGISLFTPIANDIVRAYYKRLPNYSYYAGCSTGGAQGFALAQFHPALFDGIYAGSPGNWYSHLALSFLWNAQQTDTNTSYLTQAELSFITEAVLAACDEDDGVKDSLIENPLACHFDITSLACNEVQSGSTDGQVTCLSPEKICAAQAIYSGPQRADHGSQIYPGFSLGSEIEWSLQEGPLSSLFSVPILQNLVFDDLKYDASTFNWASDVETVDRNAGSFIDEISSDLDAFSSRGGKMLTTQGWADPYNAATWPIEHLQQLERLYGGDLSGWYRLFMVPGGGHCGAAPHYPSVPATYHVLPALIQWVEHGKPPNFVLSSEPPDHSNRTRKLCSWPATAQHLSGNVSDGQSYTCH